MNKRQNRTPRSNFFNTKIQELEKTIAELSLTVQQLQHTVAGEPHSVGQDDTNVQNLSFYESLTPRENDVLHLLAKGLTYNEIGSGLGIKFSTVNQHTKAIYSKFGVNNRTEAVNTGRRLGYLS
ncbi:LuxR C-terminal-related transcriptional regulator [Chloroflexi bacterium TSY]|nr:LuxR C-terminal-related transcriptional regulator [Chloroflexi bacterium TSY]